jgi:hypothetical protein
VCVCVCALVSGRSVYVSLRNRERVCVRESTGMHCRPERERERERGYCNIKEGLEKEFGLL